MSQNNQVDAQWTPQDEKEGEGDMCDVHHQMNPCSRCDEVYAVASEFMNDDEVDLNHMAKVMKKHAAFADLQEYCAELIANLPEDTDESEHKAVGVILPLVLTAMVKFHDNFAVQQSALRAILRFVDEFKELLVREKAILYCVNALRAFSTEQELVHLACSTLNSFADNNDQNVITLTQLDTASVVLAVMGRHLNHEGVQQDGCALLNFLCVAALENERVILQRGLQLIVSSMRVNKSQPSIIEQGCMLLGNLSFSQPEKQTLVGKHGGASVLCQALKQHIDHREVVEVALEALVHLCAAHESNATTVVFNERVVPSVVHAMQKFPEDLKDTHCVQQYGSMLIAALAKINRTLHGRIIAEGGLRALIDSVIGLQNELQSTQEDPADSIFVKFQDRVQLVKDVSIGDADSVLGDANVVSHIVAICSKYIDSKSIVDSCMSILGYLAGVEDSRIEELLMKKQVATLAVSTIDRFLQDMEIVSASIILLQNLSVNWAVELGQQRVVEVASRVVTQYATESSLVAETLSLFANLAYADETHAAIINYAVPTKALSVLRNLSSSHDLTSESHRTLVVEKAFWFFANLVSGESTEQQKCIEQLMELDVVPLSVQFLRKYNDSAVISEHILSCLWSFFSQEPESTKHTSVDDLVTVLQRHPEVEEVQDWALEVLYRLIRTSDSALNQLRQLTNLNALLNRPIELFPEALSVHDVVNRLKKVCT